MPASLYNPAFNHVDDATAVSMLQRHGFGHVVSSGDGIQSSAVPFLIDVDDGGALTLRAHVARANRHWQSLDGEDVLVIVQLTDGYVSPAWYPSKHDHQRVVPTWNYELVHVRGRARVHHDDAWLRSMVTDLTDVHEADRAQRDDRSQAWAVDDAPDDFIAKQLRAIVGIEITVASVEGKRKLSQNRSDEDAAGVVGGLEAVDTPESRLLAEQMRTISE